MQSPITSNTARADLHLSYPTKFKPSDPDRPIDPMPSEPSVQARGKQEQSPVIYTTTNPTMEKAETLTLQQRLDQWDDASPKVDGISPLSNFDASIVGIDGLTPDKDQHQPSENSGRELNVEMEEGPLDPPTVAAASTSTESPMTNSARDVRSVEAALNNALGLDQLSTTDRQRLKNQLVKGECTTTALAAVFNKVPILAIRDLRQSLNGDC